MTGRDDRASQLGGHQLVPGIAHAEDPASAVPSLGETVAREAGDDHVEGVLGVCSVRTRIARSGMSL